VKKIHLVWIRREICTDQTSFTSKSCSIQICWEGFEVRGRQGTDVSLEEALLWIVDAYFGQKWQFNLKNVPIMDLFLIIMQLFTSQDVNWWTGVVWMDYCDVIISCLDSHSDGTHSLQRIHSWASDIMLHFSTSVMMKKQTHLHHGCPEWVKFQCFWGQWMFM